MYSLQSANKPLTPILQHLAQLKPSPILVHCTAGKDRTGITAMIVLLLAGCDDDSIAEEYALNDLDSNRSWGISATNRLLAQPGIYGNVGAVENVIQARKEYMLATLERFKAEYGDVETYLDGILGIDNATITAIKRNIRKSSAS
jgi:protein tyrosine/serine phosphatase